MKKTLQGHLDKCPPCYRRHNQKLFRERHPERKKAARDKYNHSEARLARERARANSDEGRAAARERMRAWRAANSERAANIQRNWYYRNQDAAVAKVQARQARVELATPPWANIAAIERIYAEARSVSRKTGEPHEVDHVIPLKGKTVCGLHCETNLRIVHRTINREKHAALIPALLTEGN
jgi:hypothetical protein